MHGKPIRLDLGDADYPPPAGATAAAASVLGADGPGSRYAPARGIRNLRSMLADRARLRLRLPADEGWIVVTAGASVALAAAILATTKPGDQVLCPDPGYPAFAQLTCRLGRRLAYYPAAEPAGPPALDAALRSLSRDTRLLIWNSPSNPLGRVATPSMVEELAALAIERKLFVLSDEVYEDIVFEGRHVSLAAMGGERFLAVYSLSKTFGLAGWRVGYLVAPPAIADAAVRAHWSLAMSASTPAQYAAMGALRAPASYLAGLLATLRERRDRASETAAEHGIPHERPAAGFFLWLDIRATGLSSEGFVAHCREEGPVLLAPGSLFGPAGEGFARLSYAGAGDGMLEGVRRVGRLYRALAGDRAPPRTPGPRREGR